jgi:AsmA protein
MRWLKRIIIGALSVVVVLVALALVVPFLIPTSAYKEQIQSRVKAATGRDLVLAGDLRFSILPSIELSARDVTLGNRPGASQKDMVRLKGLDLKLKLGPLLSGRFEVDALVLQEPSIVLEIDKDGRPNWQFDKPAGAPSAPAAPAKPADSAARPAPLPTDVLNSLQIAELRIVGGQVSYADARTGARYELARANLTVSLPGGARPFRVEGDGELRGKRFGIRAEIAAPTELMLGRVSTVTFELALDKAKVTLSGKAEGGAKPRFAGPLKIDAPSLRDLAAWAGSPLAPGSGFGAFALAANVTASSEKADFSHPVIALANLTLKLDAIAASGELSVALAAVPTLRGALTFAALDLDPYLATAAAPPSAPSAPSTPARPAPPASANPARPAVTGAIDPAPLRLANADLKISARNIKAREFRAEEAQLGVKLAAGVLTLALERVLLYGGLAAGTITVNGARTPLSVNPNLELKGLDGHRLLVAVGGTDRIAGTLNAAVNLTGTGADATAMQNSLAGTARFQFANGALRGYNLAGLFRAIGDIKNPLEIVQQVQKAVAALNRFDGAQKTDFSELSASFTASKGVFTTNDLRMSAPLLRVEGRGSIALPASALDMTLLVRAVPTLQGQGAEFAKLGIPIPLRVRGPFANVAVSLDDKALGEEIRKKAPELIKDQILQRPGDFLKKPGGILDQFRR